MLGCLSGCEAAAGAPYRPSAPSVVLERLPLRRHMIPNLR
jgi:hypothetical protein